jgi:hypothetical protein
LLGSAAAPPLVSQVVQLPGQPLDAPTRAFMQTRLGHDFSRVRVHADAQAAASARAVDALAYSVGEHVVFGRGHYTPETASGRSLLAHELVHTIQQGPLSGALPDDLAITNVADPSEQRARLVAASALRGGTMPPVAREPLRLARQTTPGTAPPDLLSNPYDDEPGAAQAREFARMTISVVKDPILEALRRADSVTFLNRLRAVGPEDRLTLENDAAFLAEVRRHLGGLAFWTVRLILRFGNDRPVYVRQLYLAVFERNMQKVRDLLRTFNELRNEGRVPGVREMLDRELRGTREHDEILQLATVPEEARQSQLATYREAHYEQPKGGGPYQLQQFTGTTAYTLVRAGAELRVVVRIHLVDTSANTFYLERDKESQWRNGIETAWNNRFTAFNGTTRLKLIFVPIFTDQTPHHTVTIHPGNDRSDEANWYLGVDGTTIAHEFGHMVGNPDEYRLPGRIADIPASMGLSADEAKRSSVEGIKGTAKPTRVGGYSIGGIMDTNEGRAEYRHGWPVLDWYNQAMKPASEAKYQLEVH